MSNVITATFGASRTTRTGAAYQYDYGQILRFTDLTLPDAYEVHFALQPHGSAVTQIGNADGVAVPDSLLEAGSTIYAWVFLHTGETDGETEYTAMIPVNRRAKPDGGTPTPVQQDAITEAIAALNTGVTRAETAAETAEGIAEAIPGTIAEALDEAVPGIVEQAVEQTEADVTDLKSHVDELDDHVQRISPRASVSKQGNTATITITDTDGTTEVQVQDGQNGEPGEQGPAGQDGVSPTITVTDITGGHRITITDATGAHSFDVMDGGGAVQDVQVNGASVVTDGVANVPLATDSVFGAVRTGGEMGLSMYNGRMFINTPSDVVIKSGDGWYRAITVSKQHISAFYALAKAAGSDEKNSTLPVGQYTESAKSAISTMLSGSVSVSGSTPTINALPGIRYVCGEVTTLDIVTPETGIVDVVFTSGATPTVLTVTPPTGMTMRWANGFDPDNLEANTTYEVNVMDGCLGVVGTWT